MAYNAGVGRLDTRLHQTLCTLHNITGREMRKCELVAEVKHGVLKKRTNDATAANSTI